MKTIPLDDAIELLDNCLAVRVDNNWITYPGIEDDGHIFLRLTNEDNLTAEFAYKDNATPEVTADGQLRLIATHKGGHGNDYLIMPLVAQPIGRHPLTISIPL